MNYWELRSQPKGMTVDRASNPSDQIMDRCRPGVVIFREIDRDTDEDASRIDRS